MSLLERLPTPTVIAHRGASAHAPENTLTAFREAVAQGAHAIEMDAKLTQDGQVVLFHDMHLGRTAPGTARIRDTRLEDLRRLDASFGFPGGFPPTQIPTLDEVLAAIALPLNIELTNYNDRFDDLPERVAALIAAHQAQDRVWISSFNPVALVRFHRALPQVPLGYLVYPRPWSRLLYRVLAPYLPHQAFHPHFSLVTPAEVRRQHRAGRRVYVYTVNDPALMRRLVAWGVDGFFTDDPALALRTLAS